MGLVEINNIILKECFKESMIYVEKGYKSLFSGVKDLLTLKQMVSQKYGTVDSKYFVPILKQRVIDVFNSYGVPLSLHR